MPAGGVSFAGAEITIDTEVVGKVTSWTWTDDISTTQVSGSEDVEGTSPEQITRDVQKPVQISSTASVEGIYIPGDTGQNDLETAVRNGTEVDLSQTDQIGYGEDVTGYFTNFEKTGSLGEVYQFTAEFHANSYTEVTT